MCLSTRSSNDLPAAKLSLKDWLVRLRNFCVKLVITRTLLN